MTHIYSTVYFVYFCIFYHVYISLYSWIAEYRNYSWIVRLELPLYGRVVCFSLKKPVTYIGASHDRSLSCQANISASNVTVSLWLSAWYFSKMRSYCIFFFTTNVLCHHSCNTSGGKLPNFQSRPTSLIPLDSRPLPKWNSYILVNFSLYLLAFFLWYGIYCNILNIMNVA